MYIRSLLSNPNQSIMNDILPHFVRSTRRLPSFFHLDVSFWFSMYGSFTGTLCMETSDGAGAWVSHWSRSGNQGKRWQYALVDLRSNPSRVEKLRFRAVTGGGAFGDIAVDDVVTTESCFPGSLVEDDGSCTSCGAGRAQPEADKKNCTECELGKYQPTQGQTSCLACPPGNHLDAAIGATTCTECATGKYQPVQGELSCLPCANGFVQPLPGQTSCDEACEAGHVVDATTGATSCTACEAGKYQPVQGELSCEGACPPATFSAAGAAECTPCGAGHVVAGGAAAGGGGATSCTACSAGTHSAAAGATSCSACAPGTFQPAAGSLACLDCPPGFAQASPGAPACEGACAAGTFSAGGAAVCTDCSAGESTGGEDGAASCEGCGPGTIARGSGVSECRVCRVPDWCPDGAHCREGHAGDRCNKCKDEHFVRPRGRPDQLPHSLLSAPPSIAR